MDEASRQSVDTTAAIVGEHSLIAAAVDGDVHAFSALYDIHLSRVYRHVYFRVGNHVEAEDVTQQVFVNAWQSIRGYRRTGAPFIAWLMAIAHNQIVSLYRVRTRRHQLNLDDLEWEPEAEQRWANPEAEILSSLDRQSVRRAILNLKPEQQQVIVMRFVENFASKEIAAMLNKSHGNIRVIQHRALTELRRNLEGDEVRQ